MPSSARIAGFVLLGVLSALGISACGGGGGGDSASTTTGTSPVSQVPLNNTPTATADVLRADAAALDSMKVTTNDTDPDGEALTVTIEEQPLVGTASVNADGTVKLASLPSGFKGVSRFRYRVTDPRGASAVAIAVIFVGVDPFRAAFAGDAAANGAVEVYLTNFVSAGTPVTAATEGSMRLRGFAVSENAATIAYRRADISASSTTDLSFVKTAAPTQQVRIAMPTGVTLAQDSAGKDQYALSTDGKWIVFVGQDTAGARGAYVLNVDTPATVSKVGPADALFASSPRFSRDSQSLYLLTATAASGVNKSLYVVSLATAAVSRVSATNVGAADDVLEYNVSSDQGRILMRANRSAREGLYFIDPAHLGTEVRVNDQLPSTDTILETTLGLPATMGGSVLLKRVGFTVLTQIVTPALSTYSTQVAEVSASPNARSVATLGARTLGFRSDDKALLYTRQSQVFEALIDESTGDTLLGTGDKAWYDSTGNIVVLQQSLPSGGTPASYPALAVTVRGAFATTQALGTPGMAAHYINVTGIDRATVLIGEGATTGAAPSGARLALVNAVAPDKLLYLADFQTPLQLTSESAQVVTN